MISAQQAFERLQQGNRRFVTEDWSYNTLTREARRLELAKGQAPFAVVLGCSDSRVPAEIIFDQGLGDLFVIRVAGNTVDPSQIGSVEFAVAEFGTPLVVVLGHSQCGAIRATVEELRRPAPKQSPNLRAIVDRIKPFVKDLLDSDLREDPGALISYAVRANVQGSVNRLRHGSLILEQLIRENGLRIVGAEYSLETGVVEFLDPLNQGNSDGQSCRAAQGSAAHRSRK